MEVLEFSGIVFGISAAAGFLGALTGLGGGVVVTPALTLLLGVDLHYAIGASLISVIATSSGAAPLMSKTDSPTCAPACFSRLRPPLAR